MQIVLECAWDNCAFWLFRSSLRAAKSIGVDFPDLYAIQFRKHLQSSFMSIAHEAIKSLTQPDQPYELADSTITFLLVLQKEVSK